MTLEYQVCTLLRGISVVVMHDFVCQERVISVPFTNDMLGGLVHVP